MRTIVSLTSWPPRIDGAIRTIRSLLVQTVRPDSVELNLAEPQFPERKLPTDIAELEACGLLNINWVPKDTNVFKKTAPVLKKYHGEGFVLLSADDDAEYSPTYIGRMLSELGDYDACCPYPGVVGYCLALRSRVVTPEYWERVTPELVECGIGDTYIWHYLNKVKARCRWSCGDDIKGLIRGFAANVTPNSERIGGYTKERCELAAKLSREALK